MRKIILLFIPILVFVFSCENQDVLSPDKQISEIELDINGLKNLGTGGWYEVWALASDDEVASVGVFTVNDQGELSENVFDVNLGYLQKTLTLFITVEEDDQQGMRFNYTKDSVGTIISIDTLFEPSNYEILNSVIKANDGTFSIESESIIDFDFNEIAGTYILDSPTDNTISNLSGIWFVNDTSTTKDEKIVGLNLPILPAHWSYEGWVEVEGNNISTGKFSNPAIADKSSLYSGDSLNWGYGFPGEDFVQDTTGNYSFPTNLSGASTYITLEAPHPEGLASPFVLRLLEATIPTNATENTVYEMENTYVDEEILNSFLHLNIEVYD